MMNMMTGTARNGAIGEGNAAGASSKRAAAAMSAKATASTDRGNENLISNEATFRELLGMLSSMPEVTAAARDEAVAKEAEVKEERLRKAYGDDYDLLDQRKANAGKPRRPGAVQLRTNNQIFRVAAIEFKTGGCCEVFSNGYAIFDNGNRKVVIWVPDCCGAVTYYFTPLRENERQYQSQSSEISEESMGQMPWYYALLIAGENRITFNMEHPKLKGNTSDFDKGDVDVTPASRWTGGTHFDDPETAYLKKEAAEERRQALTEKQCRVYEMYFELGMTTRQIADELNIQHPAVVKMVARIKDRITENDF